MAVVVKINNSTGSNANSGAGPGDGTTSGTVLTGSDASYSTTTVTLPNADLSNVLTDGSHLLYLNTSSGKKFFPITAKANSGTATANVTVSTAPTGTSSGLSYGLGGKRFDFETTNSFSKNLFADAAAGWRIELEATGTAYDLTSTINWTASGSLTAGLIEFVGTGGTPVINTGSNSISPITLAANDYLWIENIEFTSSAATRADAITHTSTSNVSNDVFLVGNKFSGFASAWGLSSSTRVYAADNEITNCVAASSSRGAFTVQSTNAYTFIGNYFHDITGEAIYQISAHDSTWLVLSNIFDTISGVAVRATNGGSSANWRVFENIFYGAATGLGLDFTYTSGMNYCVANNIFYGNSGYGFTSGVTNSVQQDIVFAINCNNAYGSNTSGNRNNVPAGDDDVTLTSDPWTDAPNGDFTLNTTAGGGADIVDAGYPQTFLDGNTSYRPIGPVWSQASALVSVTADCIVLTEYLVNISSDNAANYETVRITSLDSIAQLENLISISKDTIVILEYLATVAANNSQNYEVVGSINDDSVLNVEFNVNLYQDREVPLEYLRGISKEDSLPAEQLTTLADDKLLELEHLVGINSDSVLNTENSGTVVSSVSSDSILNIEHLLAITQDTSFNVEFKVNLSEDRTTNVEYLLSVSKDNTAILEHITSTSNNVDINTEYLAGKVADHLFNLEHLASLSAIDSTTLVEYLLATSKDTEAVYEQLHGIATDTVFPAEQIGTLNLDKDINVEYLTAILKDDVVLVERLLSSGFKDTVFPLEYLAGVLSDYEINVENLSLNTVSASKILTWALENRKKVYILNERTKVWSKDDGNTIWQNTERNQTWVLDSNRNKTWRLS